MRKIYSILISSLLLFSNILFAQSYWMPNSGENNQRLFQRSNDPSTSLIDQTGNLYTKAITAQTELFYEDSSGNVTQLTSAGGVNLGDISNVTGLFTFNPGAAVTSSSYQVGRDVDSPDQIHFNVPTGSSFEFSVNDGPEVVLNATSMSPGANGGNSLGTTALQWNGLNLNLASVINWNNSDATLTHAANILTSEGTAWRLIVQGSETFRNLILDNVSTSYANGVPILELNRTGNLTGVSGQNIYDVSDAPVFTLTEPGSGTITYSVHNLDASGVSTTAAAGSSIINTLRLVDGGEANSTNYALNAALTAVGRVYIDATTTTHTDTNGAIDVDLGTGTANSSGINSTATIGADASGVSAINGNAATGGFMDTASDVMSGFLGTVTGNAGDAAAGSLAAYVANLQNNAGSSNKVGYLVDGSFSNSGNFAFLTLSGTIGWLDYNLPITETNSAGPASGMTITTAAGIGSGNNGGDLLVTLGASGGGNGRAGQFRLGSAGVAITTDGDGAITFLSLGDGSGGLEDLTFNLDDTADTVNVSSTTNVTSIIYSNMNVTANSLQTSGNIRSSSTADIGWSVVNVANQACNTTCTNGCVFGEDTAALGNLLSCSDATADSCVCAGAN